MFPFLFLSQLNSSNSSSYLRVLQSNCQKGTAVEICTEIQSLTSKWPGVPKLCQIHRYSITGMDFPTEIMLRIDLRVSGVPTKAYFMYNNPCKLLTRIRADAGCVGKREPRQREKDSPGVHHPLDFWGALPQAPHAPPGPVYRALTKAVLKRFGLKTSSHA